jgi:Cu-processing system ATP-binding protein
VIEITNLSKCFTKTCVLNNISIDIRKGELTAIAGPNGSGKTTLIKTILGLVNMDKGKILVNGQNVRKSSDYRNLIGYMPQIARYPDNLSVREIFEMVKFVRNNNTSGIEKELIDSFELEPHLNKYMRNLSGGTRQKVGAVLAFMFNPDIYILDEPTVGLDPVSSGKFKQMLLNEKQSGKTILYISHILSEIDEIADNIVFLIDGQIYLNENLSAFKENMNESNLEKAISKYMQEEIN